ncbi:FusB/FusC family EF-G-binding protein [Lactococcus nasutitermitis]|uniref:FusB/FusC family EF-G-binding protein n=1 Tax=Lactococcus nasutitermitis TaxID=1652957 RepID=A0ABV9JFG0_9LACT|nr:FusB/FusC family EF-G-binding protein [Lactococcus nasutitermitis]
MLKSYEYNRIKYLTFDLLNAYHSVNDSTTLEAVYAQIVNEIKNLSEAPEIEQFLNALSNRRLSTAQAEKLLESLKALVEPFLLPSATQISKIFKKVKKLQQPNTEALDLRNYSYFAWNEIASGRKYIITQDGQGFYGTISGSRKNICSICQQTSQVTQFLAVTKSKADGTYTKQGNYICLDSEKCNQQMQTIEGLEKFIETIRKK